VPVDELVKAQEEDSFCKKVWQELNDDQPTRFYESADGILCRRGYVVGEQQGVVPKAMQEDIMTREHSSPLAGHPGSTKMYRTLKRKYYWPSLVADVYGLVASCETCAKNRLMEKKRTTAMRLFSATEPFAAIAGDILGPLPRTPEGYEYLLVICDRLSKVTRVVFMKDITALHVLSELLDV